MTKARLGLIGDNIAASKAPRLHALGGRMRGVEITYDLLVPAELGVGFDELFERCAAGDYHGINITHPYKEAAAARVEIESSLVRAMGAVNTVLFGPNGPRGFNTDHTGFIAAWRATFGTAEPGAVCQVGAGGVGKAVAFGLAEIGAKAIRAGGPRPRQGRGPRSRASDRPPRNGGHRDGEPGRRRERRARDRQLLSGRHGRP